MWYFRSLILLISCLIISCSPIGNIPTNVDVKGYGVSYFSDSNQDYFYQMEMEVYGRYFTGIVVVKKIESHLYRIAFTTELGNKLLDFELSNDGLQLHFAVTGLQNKRILKLLETHFKTILVQQFDLYGKTDTANGLMYQAKANHRNISFQIDKQGLLDKIVIHKGKKDYIIYDFFVKNSIFVEQMQILQPNIKYKMNLKRIL
ncbi:MAG: hypothetical protein Q4B43_00445 [Bacteroidota bacterium]|nr:hypothetical protein [Bacteroidota bacterium]